METKAKKSVLLLISLILGVAYMAYLVSYFVGAGADASTSAEAVGAGIATALVMPHMICTLVAVVFNLLGWLLNKRAFALVGAILYAVAMVLFPLYFMFVVVQMILSFVAFAKMKKVPVAQ